MVDSRRFIGSVWLVTFLLVAVWLVMFIITMPHLMTMTGGLIFDLLPFGYSPEDARTILDNLGFEGRLYYQQNQQGLDSAFPTLMFLTVSGWQIILARKLADRGLRLPNWLLVILIAINLVGAVADYGENGAVRQLLMLGPDKMTADMVIAASRMTIAKYVFDILSLILLLAMAASWFRRRPVRRPV